MWKWLKGKLPLIKSKLLTINIVNKIYLKVKEHFWYYLVCVLIGIYLYGIAINSMINAMSNFQYGLDNPTVSLNPIKCFSAVFTPQGLGVVFFIGIMYFLITGKGLHWITGVKITKDERNFFVSNEGTHGTSGWMDKKEQAKVLLKNTADELPCPVLGKLNNSSLTGISSKELAESIFESLGDNVSTKPRDVKYADHVVTKTSYMPAVLIEIGFMSNADELELMITKEFQDDFANGVAQGILNVIDDAMIPSECGIIYEEMKAAEAAAKEKAEKTEETIEKTKDTTEELTEETESDEQE